MGEYKEGKHYVFNEMGEYLEVELLEDKSDDEWEKYKLKVVKILHSSSVVKDPPSDVAFEVSRTKGEGGAHAGWYLREMGTTPYG